MRDFAADLIVRIVGFSSLGSRSIPSSVQSCVDQIPIGIGNDFGSDSENPTAGRSTFLNGINDART
jgi:hypothetical protein